MQSQDFRPGPLNAMIRLHMLDHNTEHSRKESAVFLNTNNKELGKEQYLSGGDGMFGSDQGRAIGVC